MSVSKETVEEGQLLEKPHVQIVEDTSRGPVRSRQRLRKGDRQAESQGILI